MGPRQKPWGTPHSKLNNYWYLLCAKYVCARYLLCAKYLFLTFRRCSRGRLVVGTDNNELKTKKLQSKYFLAQDKPGTSFLKYFTCIHFILKSSLFCFISSSSSSSSSLPSLLFNKYLSLTFRSCCRWWHSCRHWKWKRAICNPNNICKQDIFFTSNMSIVDCCCHLSCCTIQSSSLSSSTLSSSSSSS